MAREDRSSLLPAFEAALVAASALWVAALAALPGLAGRRGLLLVPAGLVVGCLVASVLRFASRRYSQPALAVCVVGLFGALFFQVNASAGGASFTPEGGTNSVWPWLWLACTHALRGIDVFDMSEAYGVRLSPIRPAGPAARMLLVLLHVYILLFLAETFRRLLSALGRGAGEAGSFLWRYANAAFHFASEVIDGLPVHGVSVLTLVGALLVLFVGMRQVGSPVGPGGVGNLAAPGVLEILFFVFLVGIGFLLCVAVAGNVLNSLNTHRTWKSRLVPYLLFVVVCLAALFYTGQGVRPWLAWVAESVLRMFDLLDLFEIFDWHLHELPASFALGTGSVLLRVIAGFLVAEVALGLGALWLRSRPPEELLGRMRESDGPGVARAAALLARHPRGPEVVVDLVSLLLSDTGRFGKPVMAALNALGSRAVPSYVELLAEGDADHRAFATARLIALDGHADAVAEGLSELLGRDGVSKAARDAALEVTRARRDDRGRPGGR